MLISEFDVSKKLKYLRSQFGDELKKAGVTKTNVATEETHLVKWKFFGSLSFLQKHVNVKRPCIMSNLEVRTILFERICYLMVCMRCFDPAYDVVSVA